MSDNTVIIFINQNAIKINDLFLNEHWYLTELYPRIYNITVKNIKLQWLIKVYDNTKLAKQESTILNTLKDIEEVPKVLIVGLSHKLNYVILSEASGKDLYEHLNESYFSENKTRHIIYKLLLVVKKIHEKNIFHGDIKPENIIYDDLTDNIVLIDFEGKYTEEYRCPEQIMSKKSDMWSIGITCYMLLTGYTPFNNKKEIMEKSLKFKNKWSNDCKDFLQCLLERNYIQRYTVNDALNHPWINI
jgi:serine/threonine protein kinase